MSRQMSTTPKIKNVFPNISTLIRGVTLKYDKVSNNPTLTLSFKSGGNPCK